MRALSTIKSVVAQVKHELEHNPQVRNQIYTLKEMAIAAKNASWSDRVLMVKEIKETIAYAKKVQASFIFMREPRVVSEHKGLEVRCSDEFVFAALGVLPSTPAAALVRMFGTTQEYILVNKAFLSLPQEIQLAVLDHEYGHHVYGHLEKSQGERRLSDELEADAYSASCGNDMAGALKALAAYSVFLRNQGEIKLRLEALA